MRRLLRDVSKSEYPHWGPPLEFQIAMLRYWIRAVEYGKRPPRPRKPKGETQAGQVVWAMKLPLGK